MPRLCLVTALPAESRPLLDTLKLRQFKARNLRLYGSDTHLLLETGPGKLNSAASTGAILQAYPGIELIVNIGIAGGCFDYGQTLIAHHVRDAASGAQWFPHLPASQALRQVCSASISTVDLPETDYRDGTLYDMEAAGIFSAGSRYLSTCHMHSIKVISDNPDHDMRKINKRSVTTLIHEAIPTIAPMLDVLYKHATSKQGDQNAAIEHCIRQTLQCVHHSVNDEHQLRTLLQRYMALANRLPTIDAQAASARHIRHELQSELARQPFTYGAS